MLSPSWAQYSGFRDGSGSITNHPGMQADVLPTQSRALHVGSYCCVLGATKFSAASTVNLNSLSASEQETACHRGQNSLHIKPTPILEFKITNWLPQPTAVESRL